MKWQRPQWHAFANLRQEGPGPKTFRCNKVVGRLWAKNLKLSVHCLVLGVPCEMVSQLDLSHLDRGPAEKYARMWFKTRIYMKIKQDIYETAKHGLKPLTPNPSAPLPHGDTLVTQTEEKTQQLLRKSRKEQRVNRREL